jgi:hypothetical protein
MREKIRVKLSRKRIPFTPTLTGASMKFKVHNSYILDQTRRLMLLMSSM